MEPDTTLRQGSHYFIDFSATGNTLLVDLSNACPDHSSMPNELIRVQDAVSVLPGDRYTMGRQRRAPRGQSPAGQRSAGDVVEYHARDVYPELHGQHKGWPRSGLMCWVPQTCYAGAGALPERGL